MVLRQSCGANAGGLSQVSVTGCLSGSGSLASPITLTLDPTGMITCGTFGLRMTTYPTGVGGGSGVPGAPLTSIQFNNGGSFGGSSGLTWDGTSVKVLGNVQFGGTTNLYPMVTNSTATSSELQARLADNSDLANFRAKFIYLDATGIRFNAAGNGIGVITQSNGLDFSRFCFGGTTNLFPALKKNGTELEVRLADDSAYATLRTSSLNLSSDIALERDAADNLALRRSNASQKFSIYKNYNSSVNYERGVLDWQGTSGTFRIGTEQQGLGVATPLVLMTSGTPRISIANSGIITFNQTYAFPTSIGPSGTTLVSNGTNTLNWSKPDVAVTGCIGGSGTTVSPLNLRLDPTGLLTCGAAGLRLSNASAGGGSTEYTSLKVNLTGGGTHADPVTAVDLVYNNASGTNTIDFRPIIYFNMGQVGALVADGSIDNQPRFIVPEGFQMEICRAYLTIGNPGSDDTTVQLQRYVATTDCTEPGTNGTPFSKDITSGCTWVRWTEVEGITMDSLTQLTFRVLTPGTDAANLVAHFWARTTVCNEP